MSTKPGLSVAGLLLISGLMAGARTSDGVQGDDLDSCLDLMGYRARA